MKCHISNFDWVIIIFYQDSLTHFWESRLNGKLMEIFGIGPLELLLIVLLAVIILGPKEMVETSKKAAGWLRKMRQSEAWKTTKEVMEIPNKVMKETGLEQEIRELNTISQKTLSRTTWDGDALTGPKTAPTEKTTLSGSETDPAQVATPSTKTTGGKNAS
jgi:Sec-independent protein translocase protein TatA